MKPPTSEEVSAAIAAMPTVEHASYFYSRLENPDWIGPLAARGVFEHPPAPEENPETGEVRFPDWPQLAYLARMAPIRPSEVAQVLADLDPIQNPILTQRLAQLAIELPPDEGRKLVKHFVEPDFTYNVYGQADTIGRFSARLAASGYLADALKLLRPLLKLTCTAREFGGLGTLHDPVPRVPEWEYARLVERDLPGVLEHGGRAAVFFVRGLLEDALGSIAGDTDTDYDASSLWHPEMGQDAEDGWREVLSTLVVALRNEMQRRLTVGEITIEDAKTELLSRPYPVFARLWLYLVRTLGGVEAVADALTVDGLWHRTSLGKEAFDLLHDRWSDVPEPARGEFLEAIGAYEPDSETDDDDRRFQQRHLHRLLGAVAPDLDAQAMETFERLEREHGALGRPEDGVGRTWIGPTAPVGDEFLRGLSADELVAFLRDWAPEGGFGHPSRKGLSRVLTQVVQERAEELSASSQAFVGLDSTYIGGLLNGLRDAVREDKTLDWAAVLGLMEDVASHDWPLAPRSRRSGEEPGDGDPHWGWVKMEVAILLAAGLNSSLARGIQMSERERIWQILIKLEWAPDPTVEWEKDSLTDPLSGALNTTRGQVTMTVMAYALWIRRHLEREGGLAPETPGGFESMPEVTAYLDRHLDPEQEPSACVRAVYGERLPHLVLLGPEWVTERRTVLFPHEPRLRELYAAAWEVYLQRNVLYTSVAEAIWPEYEAAVARLPCEDRWEASGALGDSSTEALGDHIMVMLFRGLVTPDSELIRGFFSRAPERARARVISRAVRFLGALNVGSLEALGRFARFWEHRCSEATAADALEELGAIGWWVESVYSPRWLGMQLRTVVAAGGTLQGSKVLEHLPRIATEAPEDALVVLTSLLRGADARWLVLGQTAEIRDVLSLTGQTSPAETDALIHWLGTRGLHQFRDLLTGR